MTTARRVRRMWYRFGAWPIGLGASLFLLQLSMAEAQEQQWLAPVVVEAQAPPAWQTYPELSTGQVSVIRRDDFLPHQFSVADVLSASPGVQVQSQGELGSYRTVSIRGASGMQALVYIDGVLKSSSGGEAVDLSQISLSQVESIEIYRTHAPPQFAEAAIGGVVNIVTRPESGQENTFLGFNAGSFGLYGLSGSRQWRQGNHQLRLAGSALKAENNFPFLYDSGTPDVPDDDLVLRRNNADFQRSSLSLDGRLARGDHLWQWQVQGQGSRKALPAWNNDRQIETWYQRNEATARLGWSGSGYWDNQLDQSIRLSAQHNEGHLYDPNAVIGINANDSRDRFTDLRANHLAVWYRQPSHVTLVNDVSYGQFRLSDKQTGQSYRAERFSHATSLTDERYLLNDRLTLLASLRTLDSPDTSRLWGAQLGGRYALNPMWSVTSNLSRAFRRPSLFEQYGNEGYFRGNPELRAEQSLTLDAAVAFEDEHRQMEVGVFYRISSQAIAPVFDSQGVGRFVNIGDVHYQGLEWSLDWQGERWAASQAGTWLPSRVYSPVALYDGRQAPGYYPVSVLSEVSLTLGPVEQRLGWRLEEGLYYDRANSTMAPLRNQFDYHARYRWRQPGGQHSLTLSLINLFNDFSMDATRKPLPGRQYVAGYSIQF